MKRSILLQWIIASIALAGVAAARDLAIGVEVELKLEGVPLAEQARISGVYKIAEDGKIHLPLVGAIRAEGLSFRQLEQLAEKSYKEREIYANPSISFQKPDHRKVVPILVGGDVRKPGVVEMKPLMLIGQAIAAAGGFEDRASKVVQVDRKGKVLTVDLRTAQGVAFLIEDNDVIIARDPKNGTSD